MEKGQGIVGKHHLCTNVSKEGFCSRDLFAGPAVEVGKPVVFLHNAAKALVPYLSSSVMMVEAAL